MKYLSIEKQKTFIQKLSNPKLVTLENNQLTAI